MSRAKHDSVTSKEDRQKNKLNKHFPKFPSKTLIQSQCLYCQLWTMFGHVIHLKFKNIPYIQRWKRIIKTRIIKLKSIENEEIIMAMAMTKIIITPALMKIIIIIIFIIAVVIIIFAIAIAIIISSFSLLLNVIILVFIILFYVCIYRIFLNFKRINIYIYIYIYIYIRHKIK